MAGNSSSILSTKKTFIKDWYGISLLFARSFNSSRTDSGKRKEIVLVDGFRLGKIARLAFDQSRYSVESCSAQNFLSESSLLNLGMDFFIMICISSVLFDSYLGPI